METLWKRKNAVSSEFRTNRLKVCENCYFPQNFQTWKFGKTQAFYAVKRDNHDTNWSNHISRNRRARVKFGAGLYLVVQACILWCRPASCVAGMYLVVQACILWCRHVSFGAGTYLLVQACILWCRLVSCGTGLYLFKSPNDSHSNLYDFYYHVITLPWHKLGK